MKKITRQWLIKHEACSDGIEWYDGLGKTNIKDIYRAGEQDDFDYIVWHIAESLIIRKKIEFAIFCAELVLPIFENEYPSDDRPRKAIEAAQSVLRRNTKKNKEDAEDAAWSARAVGEGGVASWAARAASLVALAAREVKAVWVTLWVEMAASWAAKAAVASDAAKTKKQIVAYGYKLVTGEDY